MTLTHRSHVYTVTTEPELLALIEQLDTARTVSRVDRIAAVLLSLFGLVLLSLIVWAGLQ